ncbi:heparin lyase I family protein [Echinicola shivajiensis]|uniref:heparin lyase I family protein n=1 Tax=Echinicola shivajiensis TaxID=1035916 RepID=UPI001BFC4FF5|nr:heparin lyase I family protein [Echinicola shivajiensis]
MNNYINKSRIFTAIGLVSLLLIGGMVACHVEGIPMVLEDQSCREGTEYLLEANFENDTVPGRVEICCGNTDTIVSPSFGARTGDKAWRIDWYADNYDGTRKGRGIELKPMEVSQRVKSEGWYAASFYLPSGGFPVTGKNNILLQLHAYTYTDCCPPGPGGDCKVLTVKHGADGKLSISTHFRVEGINNMTTYTYELDQGENVFDRWIDLVIHFKFSKSNNGFLEVWYDGAHEGNPTAVATDLNFGAQNCWDGDALSQGAYSKAGIYAYDPGDYTSGERRVAYYDDVRFLDGNPEDAFTLVKPGDCKGN